ncbi:anthranilate synthase component I [Truepera radiovictrix]|uniref:Anthranilate synthase component 1 n=1 Tax=Truepera radiovictrix (strain DSM 17093 / CIP 108686 / LMG 22925 / RQ-24) TaxID=649638 RepID=D7CVK8_TRURR|nr:anthranilate synthase component I [Truepera radiovictrix]ADI15919.1 anthranilate synthase component I [Truepera radiovictrix DSM 17093]WMT58454.1 anthranilate synthase component I [Truepera radiovictrix]
MSPTAAPQPSVSPETRVKPVYKEVLADLETPLTAYLKVAGHPSFLLESVEQGERVARYSFIGTGERRRLEARGRTVRVSTPEGAEERESNDPLRLLWELTVRAAETPPELPDFWAGMVGYAAYDLVRTYERLPDSNPDELGLPDLLFIEPEALVIFDHLRRRIFLVAPAEVGNAADEARARELVESLYAKLRGPLPGVPGDRAGRRTEFRPSVSKEAYMAAVAKAVGYIHAGDIFQVVPSQRLSAELGVHPFALYRALRVINPSPYLGYLDLGPVTLVASSPESLVRSDGRRVETRPIAGTRKRGRDAAEDDALARELLADAKERAEHIMLVDLGRNDLGRVCRYGSVQVSELMRVERYSHVMHIVSTVTGELADGKTPLDALAATLPMGTASGAPKVRAMEIIDELETTRRGPYAGAFGYVSVSGAMDMALTLRTAVVAGGKIHLQAGGGVVADSDPEFEYQESMNKLAALVRAVELATEGLS